MRVYRVDCPIHGWWEQVLAEGTIEAEVWAEVRELYRRRWALRAPVLFPEGGERGAGSSEGESAGAS